MPSELKIDAGKALLHAIKTDAMAAFELALSRGASVDTLDRYSNTVLMVAVRCRRLAMAERLLAAAAEAVREVADYEQPENYEATRAGTINLFRERGAL